MNIRFSVFALLLFANNARAQNTPTQIQSYIDKIDKAYQQDKDKISTYSKGWYGSINTIKTGMDGFAQNDKAAITKAIGPIEQLVGTNLSTATKAIDSVYTLNKKKILDAVAKYNAKKESLTGAVGSAIQAYQAVNIGLAKAIQSLVPAVQTPLIPVQIKYKRIRDRIDRVGAQEAAQKKRAYEIKMREFYISLAQYFPQLIKANNVARTAIINYLSTKKMNPTDVNNATQQYATALKDLNTAYQKAKMEVAFGTKANYMSIAMRGLIKFYSDDIATTIRLADHFYLNATRKKESKIPYYQYFYNLAHRLSGTGKDTTVIGIGYDAQIAKVAKQYFPKEVKAVTQYYNDKKSASINAFGKALWDLAVTVTDPTPTEVGYATAIYKELNNILALMDPSVAESSAKQANGYMASVFINQAQATLKKMQPKKDNAKLLDILINAYQQAASFFTKVGDTADATQYSNLAKNLKFGRGYLKKGDGYADQNPGQAIVWYKKAFQAFSVGGAAVSAAAVEDALNKLVADYEVKKGQGALNNFVNQYKTQMQGCMAYISSVEDSGVKLDNFKGMLAALKTACATGVKAYKKAIDSFEKLEKPVDALSDAVVLLTAIYDGLTHLKNGDDFATLGVLKDWMAAQYVHYPQALFEFRKADNLYAKALASYVPVYPTLVATQELKGLLKKDQKWDLNLFFNRYIAKRYSEVGNTTPEELLRIQYYAGADGTRLIYLSDAVDMSLSNSLEIMLTISKTFYAGIDQAREQQSNAVAMSANAWVPEKTMKHFYMSKADNVWQDVLKRFATLYRFGMDKSVGVEFLNAVAAYAQVYQQSVPKEFYPEIGTVLIHFREFVVYTITQKRPQATASLKQITGLAENFFSEAQTLQTAVDNKDLILSASDNQKKLVEWKDRFEQAVNKQNAVIAQLAPKAISKTLQLFSKTVDAKMGNITCNILSPGKKVVKSITILNPELKLAGIYKKMGDVLNIKADYKGAYYAYYYARNYYNKVGNIALANEAYGLYKKAYTRSIYHAYLRVIGKGQLIKVLNINNQPAVRSTTTIKIIGCLRITN